MRPENLHPTVDRFLDQPGTWRAEYRALRAILQGSGLEENFKWGWPCYHQGGANIVLIHGFKDYCALLFFKGALIEDPAGLLIQQTGNVQSARQMRFISLDQIAGLENAITAYVQNAICIEQSGAKVARKTTLDFDVPEELTTAFNTQPALRTAFDALTPGRQRGWLLHFAGARQSATRTRRIAAASPKILAGKGMDDPYP